jgi:hypothetical protein
LVQAVLVELVAFRALRQAMELTLFLAQSLRLAEARAQELETRAIHLEARVVREVVVEHFRAA